MNIFGEEEKKIIDKIVLGEGYSRNLINILDSLSNLQGVRISVDPSTNTAEYLFEIASANPTTQECDAAIEREKELTQKLITHLLVLESLEKDELAFFYTPASPSLGKVVFGAGASNMPPLPIPIYDKKIIKLLIQYLHVEIVPKPSLVHLQNNNYKSDNEQRFHIQMIATWSALAVSIAIGLVGIFNNYESAKASDKKHAAILNTVDSNVAKIETSIKGLASESIDYSKSFESIEKSIGLVSEELKVLSKKEIVLNATVEIPERKNNKSMQPTANTSARIE